MRAAIVGLGVIGRVHAEVLRAQGETLCAVCDTDAEKLKDFSAAKYGDYLRLLDEERPDVVHVCTPHYLHADMVTEALKRNIDVLCEKPLCISEKDIPRILEAEKRSAARLGVCHQNRYNAANAFVKEYLKNKQVRGAYATVVWRRDAAYYASGDWRGRRATEGGGVLINQALHTLDLLQWLVGEPEYVAANVSNLTLSDVIEVEDTAAAIFSGGAEFSLFATVGSAADFPVSVVLRTDAETITLLPDTVLINGKIEEFQRDGRAYGKGCYGTGHEKLIADFYDCMRTGRHFMLDGAEGAKVVKLILAAYASGGKRIKI